MLGFIARKLGILQFAITQSLFLWNTSRLCCKQSRNDFVWHFLTFCILFYNLFHFHGFAICQKVCRKPPFIRRQKYGWKKLSASSDVTNEGGGRSYLQFHSVISVNINLVVRVHIQANLYKTSPPSNDFLKKIAWAQMIVLRKTGCMSKIIHFIDFPEWFDDLEKVKKLNGYLCCTTFLDGWKKFAPGGKSGKGNI